MRAVLFILILAIVALLIAFATGLLNLNQTRTAQAPQISVNRSGVSAAGGRTPAFDVETGSVSLGTTEKSVSVPTVRVNPPPQAQNEQESKATSNAG
jgi:hypothetical protein